MTDIDELDRVPDDLAAAVHRAAAAYPDYSADLTGVYRRRSRLRRRRLIGGGLASVAAMTAALAAGALALPVVATDGPSDHATPPAAAPSSTRPPDQRMLLNSTGWTRNSAGGPEIGVIAAGGVKELLPDGTVVNHPVSGVDSIQYAVPAPGNRLAVLGPVDLTPGVPREDGPRATDLEQRLVVYGADGATQLSRNVRVNGQPVALLAVTDTDAILVREHHLIAHNLTTGAERPMAGPGQPITDGVQGLDLVGDRLAIGGGISGGCRPVRIYNTLTGAVIATLPTQPPACWQVTLVKLSADGQRVAYTYSAQLNGRMEDHLVVVDVAAGAVLLDRPVRTTVTNSGPVEYSGLRGIAWSDPRTVRLAWTQLPPDAHRVFKIEEVLKSADFQVP